MRAWIVITMSGLLTSIYMAAFDVSYSVKKKNKDGKNVVL